MADLTASTTLNPVDGNAFVNVGTVDTSSKIYRSYPGDLIVSGDQIEYTDSPNTSVAVDTSYTQTVATRFQVRVWRAASEAWSGWYNTSFAVGVLTGLALKGSQVRGKDLAYSLLRH